MRRVLIATHGKLAQGFKDSVNMIAGGGENVSYMSFYTEERNYDADVKSYMEAAAPDDETIVLTDMAAGSVNQKFIPYLSNKNVFLVTGINLPAALELVMYKGPLDYTMIERITAAAVQELYIVTLEKIRQQSPDESF